jgi:hypothetical protein
MILGQVLPPVDPDQVAAYLAAGRDAIAEHHDDCECAWCFSAAMDVTVAENGLDPSRYWAVVPRKPKGSGFRAVPWWRTPHPKLWLPRPAEFPALPERDRVSVPVYCLPAGAWAHFTGVDAAGAPVTVAGAVLAGPDEVTAGGAVRFAVLVRTYRPGEADRVVYVDPDVPAVLVDDPADHAARRAHAVAAVFPPGADRVELYRRVPATRKGRRDRWAHEIRLDVSAEQLAGWERASRDVRLSAVVHGHVSIPGGVL